MLKNLLLLYGRPQRGENRIDEFKIFPLNSARASFNFKILISYWKIITGIAKFCQGNL